MTASVKPIPDTSSTVIPRLFCRDVSAESEFCRVAFGAEELGRRPGPDGTIIHALLKISGEMVMIEGEFPSLPSRVPALDGTSPVVIFVYVADVDQAVERAVTAGAKILIPLKDQFWGDRMAWIMDPAGHVWTVASRIEETSAEQRGERWEKIRSSL